MTFVCCEDGHPTHSKTINAVLQSKRKLHDVLRRAIRDACIQLSRRHCPCACVKLVALKQPTHNL